MSNIYADAVNAALGVKEVEPPVRGKFESAAHFVERERKYNATPAPRPSLGRIHSESYRGYSFLIREFGASSFGGVPPLSDYWSVYMTDDELEVDLSQGDFEQRIRIARLAIDRAINGEVMHTGKWYDRKPFDRAL